VAPQHHHHAARATGGIGDGANDGAEIPRDENVGQRVEECAERSVARRWMGEIARADLVLPDGDGNGANRGKVSFRGRGAAFV
jgi:hypothetical protein